MRRRQALAFPLAVTAALLLAGTAAAGGWATATLDPPPDDPTAGEPVEIGFTLMQHGVTPVNDGPAQIHLINRDTGERASFNATPTGSGGRWTAEVVFPTAATYGLQITHDLQIQPVNVDEISVTVASSAPATTTTGSSPSVALAILAAAAGLLLAAGLWFLGGRRVPAAQVTKRA